MHFLSYSWYLHWQWQSTLAHTIICVSKPLPVWLAESKSKQVWCLQTVGKYRKPPSIGGLKWLLALLPETVLQYVLHYQQSHLGEDCMGTGLTWKTLAPTINSDKQTKQKNNKKSTDLRACMERQVESHPTGKSWHWGITHARTFKSHLYMHVYACMCGLEYAKPSVCVILCIWMSGHEGIQCKEKQFTLSSFMMHVRF